MAVDSKLKIVLWVLGGIVAGAVIGGTLGGLIVWIQIQGRPTGWDGIFIASGVLTAGLIGSGVGLVVGITAAVITSRRKRGRTTRRRS